ncbi:NUDIX hydrolase [Candidatus Nucleicultrix amoebiphila]|uniref:8-oxo-dGTP diphosphatase n=1 Tax=Candidatus Nucleicultrix amoebiphila FS5 TaxID=1414854 RepID=A0A1W6N6D3_9PROT|nr:NUDIX domain-containing protein [Candidatus Nucleicultrix amoebiphila]ARN85361.1 hypothetical protein GQ61_08755 [Candidatus Nucleicultrix amoebiphila FS5]
MKKYLVIVECAIEHNHKFLIIKRPIGSHGEGTLAFPGGKVEEQDEKNTTDALIHALKREVQEEVGLILNDPLHYVTSCYFFVEKTQMPVIDVIFHCRLKNTLVDVKASQREVPEFYWMSKEDIEKHENTPPWLKKYMYAISTMRT